MICGHKRCESEVLPLPRLAITSTKSRLAPYAAVIAGSATEAVLRAAEASAAGANARPAGTPSAKLESRASR